MYEPPALEVIGLVDELTLDEGSIVVNPAN